MSYATERISFSGKPRQKLIDCIHTFAEAVYIAESESRWRVIIPGEKRANIIDPVRFGELPIHTEQGLQCLADESVRFLDNVVATDKFKQKHSKRRKWRDGLSRRMGFGFELKKHFKKNRLSGNGITCLVSAANIAERRLTATGCDVLVRPDLCRVLGAIHEIQSIPGDHFAHRYIVMTNGQKREVANKISAMASGFLDIVNPQEDRRN